MKRYLFLSVTLILFFSLAANAFAAIYYVKNGGSDGNTGLSDAQAWETVSKVNSSVSGTGDDVYFKCDDTWTGTQLGIDWSGNATNRTIVGAYYGGGTIGVSGNKPIINGNDTVPPNDSYQGLIQVKYQNYVTVENFKITKSGDKGLNFDQSSYCNALNILAETCDSAGIRYKTVAYGTTENCEVTDCARRELRGAGWPACLVTLNSHDIVIRNNIVHENYGEGIGIYTNSYDCLVENNICYANKKVQIYVCWAWDNTVRRNLCYGTTDPTFHRSSFGPSLGIGISDESWQSSPGSKNNKLYNNMVAYCSTGIFLWSGFPNWALKDTDVYNNTVVDCGTNLKLSSSRTAYENSHIKNNIFWSIGGDSVQASVPSNHSGLTIDYNLWSSTPDTDAQGANDPAYAAPLLTKTSGWRSMAGGDLTGNDFTLQNTSPAIDVGVNLGASYDDGLDPDSVWPGSVTTLDQDLYGSGWEIGAFVFDFTIYNALPVNNATGISITVDLSWTNPTGTTNIDLLFDKKSEHDPPTTVELNDQNVETWDCGTLDYSTEYAWRVDVNHSGGTETGSVYYFTTTSQANPPLPSVGMNYCPGGVSGSYSSMGLRFDDG